ncbi:hypothetical protein GH733_018736 [Mirounga leonina]|nr:hypothetical protein GH733_018736 [Mirounga leonina]
MCIRDVGGINEEREEFKATEDVALGSPGSCSMEVEKETQEKMTILQTFFQQNRDEVLQHLLAFLPSYHCLCRAILGMR